MENGRLVPVLTSGLSLPVAVPDHDPAAAQDEAFNELNRNFKLGNDFLVPFWAEMQVSMRADNPMYLENLRKQLSSEVGRVLAANGQLSSANQHLSSRVHFLQEERNELMERLVVTKKEFDAVRDQVVEQAQQIATLAKADEEKARQIATLVNQAEATRLKFEAIEALFARQERHAAEGKEFAQYSAATTKS
jgi:chromosome segregation ATPase